MSFAFQDSIKIIGERGTENMGDFRYEYILNELGIGKPKDGEGMLVMDGEAKGSSFSIMMADEDLSLWNTRLTTGEKAELNGKWYMSSLLAMDAFLCEKCAAGGKCDGHHKGACDL